MKKVIVIIAMIVAVFAMDHFNNSPQGIYNEVKREVMALGVDVPFRDIDKIIFKDLGDPYLYGYSADMGAYAGEKTSTIIYINTQTWDELSRHEKKILLLHEWMHSEWTAYHCYNTRCVMGKSFETMNTMTWEEVLLESLEHHNIYYAGSN